MFKLKVVPSRDSHNSFPKAVEFSLGSDESLDLEIDGDRKITFSDETVMKLKKLLKLLED